MELKGKHIDTLVALVEGGPLDDGDVPSKSARDELIGAGLAVRVVVKLQDGYTAATYAGREAYKEQFGNADSMREAQAFRQAGNAISRAR
ncbi:hypothetical protein [Burkholderia cenocepacia]|uniref:Uncharacterized protein n=1 Tax=Burkholderia cenocepacia TaxID=95486 RepID=A0A1V2W361_9BURK|nr:hypothetical protein [Burkholderia cenocepacia]MBR8248674.1 hypothetical protein [Burkholderia cenocepacia]MBR8288848.1 hypothetical protein [Burkholderia cenocepacia]MBR8497117.1 hypothetical protein [Burkholderia cenocepacia]ONJ13686.1 hypothetical protein A8D83_12010 [Burkholderia cenocepacia]ONJ30210.1 hypothetical protein A8D90_07200 [Burkholderia cenocepacia]